MLFLYDWVEQSLWNNVASTCLLKMTPITGNTFALKVSFVIDWGNFFFFIFLVSKQVIRLSEPFDRTNTARSVYDPAAFQKIVDVFRQSAAKISQTKDLSSVMT